jgi:GT2 family glycosyltransferase
MPRISAIIVTRNNRKDIQRCLASLQQSRHPVHEVIVIDNDSRDGTPDCVRRGFPDASVLDFWDNPGFGEGNNRGARVASGDYLLLLNPDATVAPDCIDRLVDEFEHDPQLGMAVPKVVLASEPSIINSAGLFVNSVGYGWDRGYLEWDTGQYDRTEPILAGSGCALMVRADVYRALGGFDAPYFLYYEDLDLCWRSWIAGHPVRYVPAAVAHHTMKISGRPALYNDYLDHRNRLRTILKNLSAGSLVRMAPGVLAFEAGSAWAFAKWRQWASLRHRVRAWSWNVGHLPDTLARRRTVQRSRAVEDEKLADRFARGRVPQVRAALPNYPPAYDHLVDRAQLSTSVTMGTNDVGALGLGWHGLESFDGLPSRWCCGYGIAFLGAPGSCDHSTLTIKSASMRPTEVIVRTGRVERGRFAIAPGPWHELTTEVPITGDIVRVEILVAPTFVPSESDPTVPDNRTLGIAVSRMTLFEGLAS